MDGTEFRSIRKGLGLTLKQMGEALDLSETYVGQMERGQRTIEKRTALAARYLALVGQSGVTPIAEIS